jgi:hypothetical protein
MFALQLMRVLWCFKAILRLQHQRREHERHDLYDASSIRPFKPSFCLGADLVFACPAQSTTDFSYAGSFLASSYEVVFMVSTLKQLWTFVFDRCSPVFLRSFSDCRVLCSQYARALSAIQKAKGAAGTCLD